MKPLRLLPALIPILIGMSLPTIAFHIAQQGHSYVAGQDEDSDVMVSRAASALPLVTAVTIPGFLGLGIFLYVNRKRLNLGFLWLASLAGTSIMTAIVLGTHPGMYDLLYSRGRMHSTTGVGMMFVSFYCVIAAVIIAAFARHGQNIWIRRGQRRTEWGERR
jgi:hypothetical protein